MTRHDYAVLTLLVSFPHLDPSDLPDRSLDAMSAVTPCHVPQTVTSHIPLTLTCYINVQIHAYSHTSLDTHQSVLTQLMYRYIHNLTFTCIYIS